MFRALTIVAAVAALAVTASPASAGSSKKPPTRTAEVVVLIGANDYGLVTRSHGEILGSDWVMAPRGLTGGIPDGTSNTMMVRTVVTERMSATHYFKPKPLSLNTLGGDDTL